METIIISLGGSVICPQEIDVSFIKNFIKVILETKNKKFIIICGGGRICRQYQDAARKGGVILRKYLDWIGIKASVLNAELVRSMFQKKAYEKIIQDPNEIIRTNKKIILGAGHKPGSSTDLIAVKMGCRFTAKKIINISNVDYAYSKDPNKHLDAKKIKQISWKDFRKLVGNRWKPGLNMPFDPIASIKAEKSKLNVIITGKNISNLKNILQDKKFKGTIIS